MSFSTGWDVDRYKCEHESEEHWQLRKKFIETHKNRFPEEKLVCLARVFFNIEFLGCRYPEKTMQLVADLSKGVADEFREKQKGKLKRTFVQASDAASSKIQRAAPLEPPSKIIKTAESTLESTTPLHSCFVHANLFKEEEVGEFPGFIIFENRSIETNPSNILTTSAAKNKKKIEFELSKIDKPGTSQPSNVQERNETKTQDLRGGLQGGFLWCCEVKLDGKILSSATENSTKEAKLKAAIEGLNKLRKTCYTIQAKHSYFSHDPPMSKEGGTISENYTPLSQDNIGCKIMQKMGWTGGTGLGKEKQGIQTPIQASSQIIRRAGFGCIGGKGLQTKFAKIFNDYIASDNDCDLVFTPDFSSDERKILHKLAQQMNLKTRSFSKGEERHLVVFKFMTLPSLKKSLLQSGGQNDKYLLIPPSNNDGPSEMNVDVAYRNISSFTQ